MCDARRVERPNFVGGCVVKSGNSQDLTDNELAALIALADIGEMTRPVTHEFNNFLNTLLLHLAVIEPKIPEDMRSDVEEVRKQARNATTIIKELQLHRRQRQVRPGPADLNNAVRSAIAKIGHREHVIPAASETVDLPEGEAVSVELDLDAKAALVPALSSDLVRLCTFLLHSAEASASGSGRPVLVRTRCSEDKVTLDLEYSVSSASRESLASFFDLSNSEPDRAHRLELAASKSLAKRLQGRICAEHRSENAIAIRVELPRNGG
jgi:signal transduction histidine kinase